MPSSLRQYGTDIVPEKYAPCLKRRLPFATGGAAGADNNQWLLPVTR